MSNKKNLSLICFVGFFLLSGLWSMKYPFEPLCILHFSRPMLATCSMYFLYLFSPTFENWMAFFKGWHISCSIWHVWLFFPFFAPKSFLEVGRTEGTTFFMCTYFLPKIRFISSLSKQPFYDVSHPIFTYTHKTLQICATRNGNLKLFFDECLSLTDRRMISNVFDL